MQRRLLNFLHIPKTAGTTFISILKRNFHDRQILQIDGMDPERTRADIELRRSHSEQYELLMGHWSVEFEKYFANRDIVRIVFLRDPVRHFLSTYYYIRKTPVHLQHTIANQLSLDEFLDFRKEMNLDNLQTRHLGGVPTNMVAGKLNFDLAGEAYLEKSKRVLNECRYPFLTEKFDEALQILGHDRILKNLKYTRENVSVNKDTLSVANLPSTLREKILDINRFDASLHNYAKQLYVDLSRGYEEFMHRKGLMRSLLGRVRPRS